MLVAIGRLYDGHILDMIELGVEQYAGLSTFKVFTCSYRAICHYSCSRPPSVLLDQSRVWCFQVTCLKLIVNMPD